MRGWKYKIAIARRQFMTISISDKLAKLSETKLFITLGIIVVLFLSYLYV